MMMLAAGRALGTVIEFDETTHLTNPKDAHGRLRDGQVR
jgi:hypothetical protein